MMHGWYDTGGYSMTNTESQPDHAESVEACIGIDIACPDCEYNLRGLPGPIVDCPECGLTTDVPVLAARQWDKPWYRAPGFNTLMWPAVVAFIGWITTTVVSTLSGPNQWATYAWMLLALAIWLWLMFRATKLLKGSVGFFLALLAHALVLGFLVGIVGLMVMAIATVLDLIQGDTDLVGTLSGVAWLVGFSVLLWVCRRIERAIAGVCIRHHLRRKPTN
jgi:hypothetical protein